MIAAVVLVAGGSFRLGQPKQLLEFEGRSLVRRTVGAAIDAGCAPVVVVVGAEQERIAAALHDLEVTLVPNEVSRRGIGTSIRRGVEHVRACDALIILACDQPHVNASLLRQYVAQHQQSPQLMVAAAYAGTLGIPVLFPRAFFNRLVSLGEDAGAKALLAAYPDHVVSVDFPAGAVDIDTREDFDAISRRPQQGPAPRPDGD